MSEIKDWISAPTRYLTLPEMANNAKIIYQFFKNQVGSVGWTLNAIAGMLGNMQTESYINPGLWQGREIPSDIYTTKQGYGLVQWTPANKYITWADEMGFPYDWGETQCMRIHYESQFNLQWSTNNILNMTWDEYITSTESPEILARVWLWAYERPDDPVIADRQKQARFWFEYLAMIESGLDMGIYAAAKKMKKGAVWNVRATLQP